MSNNDQKPSLVGKIVWVLLTAAVGGILGAVLTYFSEEIRANAEHLVMNGNLGGEYVLETKYYVESDKSWKPYDMNFRLMHGGTRVFGKLRSVTSNRTWTAFGYFRPPMLALSYENTDPAAAGVGTYSLTEDIPFVMWGHWLGIECDYNRNKRFVAQCPAILYRTDHAGEKARYTNFMQRDCISITTESGPCPVHSSSSAIK